MDFDNINEKYEQLLQENKMLREENEQLRKLLSESRNRGDLKDDFEEEHPTRDLKKEHMISGTVNNQSSPEEKIKLFLSLFSGRTDVYAKRWYSLKTKKNGYQPACANEWDLELCNKQRYKCGACPNSAFFQLDEKTIYAHLAGKDLYGRDVVGMYSMFEGDTCPFLVVDFDGKQFEKDARAFYQSCWSKSIPAYMERSRSGEGAHIWIFFTENISAALARRLGSSILTYTMESRGDISFDSYDRFFPNQDRMPEGGFGNLIALPLQG
ncbi:MAG: hypothetical protein Q4C25_08320 [Bacillota bacterium]|nr:hypothetical protein [Bacillota bacterium]